MPPGTSTEIVKPSQKVRQAARKRHYDLDYKLRVVNETLAPGSSVSMVARRHDINANVVFCWRKRFREGALGGDAHAVPAVEAGFIPIHVTEDEASPRALPAPEKAGGGRAKTSAPAPGLIEIETAGGATLRIEGRVDERTLRCVLAAIGRLS